MKNLRKATCTGDLTTLDSDNLKENAGKVRFSGSTGNPRSVFRSVSQRVDSTVALLLCGPDTAGSLPTWRRGRFGRAGNGHEILHARSPRKRSSTGGEERNSRSPDGRRKPPPAGRVTGQGARIWAMCTPLSLKRTMMGISSAARRRSLATARSRGGRIGSARSGWRAEADPATKTPRPMGGHAAVRLRNAGFPVVRRILPRYRPKCRHRQTWRCGFGRSDLTRGYVAPRRV